MNQAALASFSKSDQAIFLRIQDYLNQNVDAFINYKEFMAFFFLKRTFKLLSNASIDMTTSQTRLIAGFKLLGIRLSVDDLSNSSTGFNDAMNEETMNISKAFIRALREENLIN